MANVLIHYTDGYGNDFEDFNSRRIPQFSSYCHRSFFTSAKMWIMNMEWPVTALYGSYLV